MARIERFEDFEAWQEARRLTKFVYEMTRCEPFARDFRLASQLQAASVSIMSNIAEGYERGRASEFHQFLSIAKGSCAEVRSQLYVALDIAYISPAIFEDAMARAVRVSRLVGGLRASVEARRNKESGK
jgi:four helix bundle protein